MSRIQFAAESNGPPNNDDKLSTIDRVSSYRRFAAAKAASIEKIDALQDPDLESKDRKHRQEFSGWILLWLAYQSTGVIYGDIGTSPLYVYSSTFSSSPSYEDLVGVLSLIIWTITLMVSVKYILIVLRADDEGEGGTFALYSLLARYANIATQDPSGRESLTLERHLTDDMRNTNKKVRSTIEGSMLIKWALKLVGVAGVSLVIADGVLTPAQSVLGAIQGLKIPSPNIATNSIIGITCAILVVLFVIQPLGTSKLASAFAPIVILWLLFNLVFGIYNLVHYDHSVLKGFSPAFAIHYLSRNGTNGWISLGGVLLSVTGMEALFADLGAFSRRSIQLSWLGFAYPCLLVAYIGQAAYISRFPDAYANPFFESCPRGTFWPSFVLSILAAVVASQAMITSTFQLLSQVMQLSYFPQIKIVHTSQIFYGQIYVPLANWLLMAGTLVVTGVYNNTTHLGHAYGVCVILVTFITTCMVTMVALIVWRLHFLIVIPVFLIFASLDGLYLSASLTKVPDGAWFTLVLALILSTIFVLWRYGKETQWAAESTNRLYPSDLIDLASHNPDISSTAINSNLRLTKSFGSNSLTPTRGLAVFFDKQATPHLPSPFLHFVRKFEAAPRVSLFFHFRPCPIPSVPIEERYRIARSPIPGAYRIIVRHGYTEHVVSEDLAHALVEQVRAYINSNPPVPVPAGTPAAARDEKQSVAATEESTATADKSYRDSATASMAEEVNALTDAFNTQVVYVVGKEQMLIGSSTMIVKRVALAAFLWLRENTRTKVAAMKVPVDKLIEVGFVKQI